MKLKEFVKTLFCKKLYPYQESLLLAMSKGKINLIPYPTHRKVGKVRLNNILTCTKMLEMEKGKTIAIVSSNGYVKFKCIENTLLKKRE